MDPLATTHQYPRAETLLDTDRGVDLSRAGIVTMLASMDVQPETVALLHSLKPVRLAIGSRWCWVPGGRIRARRRGWEAGEAGGLLGPLRG